MRDLSLPQAEKYTTKYRRKQIWYKVLVFLSAIVVFATTYALILPAVTMELSCALEEHTHTAECYSINSEGEVDVSLVCQLEEHQHTDDCYTPVALAADLRSEPLDAAQYITDGTILYRPNADSEWLEIGEEEIPADAEFKLTVNYSQVPINAIINSNYQLVYTPPKLFSNIVLDGAAITDDKGNNVGSISSKDGKIYITFNEQWINEQKDKGTSVIKGSFYLQTRADLSNITDGENQIVIGNTTIKINFGEDVQAKYGDVTIDKTLGELTEEESGDYLNYSITVTAGGSGCPAVVVKDSITKNPKNIADYVFDDTENIVIDKENSIFTWNVGDMEPNEVRTLNYKLKLIDGYTGATPINNSTVINSAQVFSTSSSEDNRLYLRDESNTSFTPHGDLTLSKTAAEYQEDPETGGGTIRYTIWVKADDNNSYTLDDVLVHDTLDGSFNTGFYTSPELRPHLNYEKDDFHLYSGGKKNQNGGDGLTEITDGIEDQPTYKDNDNDGKNNDCFIYNIGSLGPGESKTLVYTVRVDPQALIAAGNNDILLRNRVGIYSEGMNYNNRYDGYQISTNIGHKSWLRKLSDDPLTSSKVIEIPESDNVYDATGGSVTKIENPSNFTVPAGSFPYYVVVNESGDWTLNRTLMTDTVSPSEYMAYSGFVQINAYEISEHTNQSSDEEALKKLKNLTPVKTVWVNVDDLSTFQFRTDEVGINGTYAYLITYYACPKNTSGITSTSISNEFTLKETITWGNGSGSFDYELKSIGASSSVTVSGNNYFSARKDPWYYDENATGTTNGAIYWLITIDGNRIPNGTKIRDVWTNSAYKHNFKNLVGAFTSKAQNITSYSSFLELENSEILEYDVEFTQTTESEGVVFTLLKDVVLDENEYLYFVVSTEPERLPTGRRDYMTFQNNLSTLDAAESSSWVEQSDAKYTIYGRDGIFKELGQTFTYDGEKITTINNGDNSTAGILTNKLESGGVYAAWQIQINHDASLKGKYRIEEQIPKGMEVAYFRIYWMGSSINGRNPRPDFVEIPDLDSSWERHQEQFGGTYSNAIYYTKGQTLICDIDNIYSEFSNEAQRDKWNVEFQIVCRVTDEDLLLGGIEETFTNNVVLKKDDTILSQDNHSVTLSYSNINKTGLQIELNGNKTNSFGFTIEVNELGDDLIENSDTIILVDEMCKYLVLDPKSIKITNSATGETVTNWTSSIEGQTLKLTLPDGIPLTIYYETTINAKPGEKISITNNAYWYGYAQSGGSGVEEDDVGYGAGGIAITAETPTVKIYKLDQYDNSKHLPGATFSLMPGNIDETTGEFIPSSPDTPLRGTTDEEGVLIFQTTETDSLAFNTIYQLTEYKAPDGYVKDTTPHYFVVIKDTEDEKYATITETLEKLETMESDRKIQVTAVYSGSEYVYYAYNHKGEITLNKQFADAAGNPIGNLGGTYTFGLYETEDGSGTPLQTIKFVYNADGSSRTDKFTNLDLGKTYYIFELDDEGNPIANGNSATASGKPFIVTYENNSITLSETSGSVIVTNRTNYPELPATGGLGTTLFTTAGLLLILIALLGLCYKILCKKGDRKTS